MLLAFQWGFISFLPWWLFTLTGREATQRGKEGLLPDISPVSGQDKQVKMSAVERKSRKLFAPSYIGSVILIKPTPFIRLALNTGTFQQVICSSTKFNRWSKSERGIALKLTLNISCWFISNIKLRYVFTCWRKSRFKVFSVSKTSLSVECWLKSYRKHLKGHKD